MAIELNTKVPQQQIDTLADGLAKSGFDSAKAKEIVGKAMEVLAGANLKVSRADVAGADGAAEKKTSGATNVPALDNPNDIKQLEADLTKLIAFLQLDNEERQTAMAKERINLQKAALDTEHQGRLKEIDESIKKMKDAERASTMSRIFGWIGAVLSVVAAVALTVVTGGAAAGFAIAGAVLAVSSLVLNETGAMDKMIEKLAEHLQEEYGLSKNDAMMKASLIINLTIMAASLLCSVGGMVAGFSAAASASANAASTAANVTKTVSQTAKTVQSAVTIANTGVSAASLATGGVTTYLTNKSETARADLLELEKLLTSIQQQIDESQEELEQLMAMIQSGLGKVAELIGSSTDTAKEIAEKTGQMA